MNEAAMTSISSGQLVAIVVAAIGVSTVLAQLGLKLVDKLGPARRNGYQTIEKITEGCKQTNERARLEMSAAIVRVESTQKEMSKALAVTSTNNAQTANLLAVLTEKIESLSKRLERFNA